MQRRGRARRREAVGADQVQGARVEAEGDVTNGRGLLTVNASAPETRNMQERQGGEARGVEEVVDRLARKYPGVERSQIEKIVAEEHQAFDGHPVRDFVPVLVEKHAKKRVKDLARPETHE